jgi:hypothetical protein
MPPSSPVYPHDKGNAPCIIAVRDCKHSYLSSGSPATTLGKLPEIWLSYKSRCLVGRHTRTAHFTVAMPESPARTMRTPMHTNNYNTYTRNCKGGSYHATHKAYRYTRLSPSSTEFAHAVWLPSVQGRQVRLHCYNAFVVLQETTGHLTAHTENRGC